MVLLALCHALHREQASSRGRKPRFYFLNGRLHHSEWMSKLQPLSLDHLASAVAERFDNESFLEYLVGSAAHLREKCRRLRSDSAGSLLGCVWGAGFEGFFFQLNAKLTPVPGLRHLFDLWSLLADVKNICAEKDFTLCAERMRARGKKAWSCSVASDETRCDV